MLTVETLTAHHWLQGSTRTVAYNGQCLLYANCCDAHCTSLVAGEYAYCTHTMVKPRNQEPRLHRPMKMNLGLGCVLWDPLTVKPRSLTRAVRNLGSWFLGWTIVRTVRLQMNLGLGCVLFWDPGHPTCVMCIGCIKPRFLTRVVLNLVFLFCCFEQCTRTKRLYAYFPGTNMQSASQGSSCNKTWHKYFKVWHGYSPISYFDRKIVGL